MNSLPAIKKIQGLLCSLALLCSSCAGDFQNHDAEVAPEPADTACAYSYFLWGKSAEFSQRYEEALEAFEKVLVCDSQAVFVMRDLAVLLVKMGREGEAAVWFKKLIDRQPEETGTRLLLAKLYTGMGKVDEAAAIYKELLDRAEDPYVLLMLGALYAQNRQYGKAQEVLTRLIGLDRNSYLGHYYLARLYRDMHFFKRALASYEKALALNWSVALALEMVGLYEAEERFDEAIALCRRVLEEDAANEQARIGIINICLTTEQFDSALAELRELKNYVTEVHGIDLTIGRVYLSQGKYDQAVAVLSAILADEPALHAARYMLAIALQQKGDSAAAQKMLASIPPDAKEFEDSVLMLVKIHRDENDWAAAIKVLEEKISDENTAMVGFYVVLAALYRQQDRLEEAGATFERALRKFPGHAGLLYEYALFLDRTGKPAAALTRMQEVLLLEPQNAYALNYVGFTWAENNTNLTRALAYLQKAVSLKPDDGYIRDSLGWVHYRLGDFENAVAELEKAVGLTTNDPVIYEHLGDAYLGAADRPAARRAYEKAFELYEEEPQKAAVGRKLKDLDDR